MLKSILAAIVIGMILGLSVWKFTPIKITPETKQEQFKYDFMIPPSDSIIGKVASVSGSVFYKKRIGEDVVPLDKDFIYQGENLIASESGKITVDFSGTTISLEPKTEVDIIQTLPYKFVFNQILGTAQYSSGSIRVKRLLVEATNTTKIEVKDALTKVTGSGKIAYNDINYNSQVLDLVEGKTLTFNDTRRAVLK